MTDISRSPERGSFAAKHSKNVDSSLADVLELMRQQVLEREQEESWKINNLEYDLRSNQWILDKTRSSEVYSQHLYAALCNNDFRKTTLENTPENIDRVLADGFPKWSCSWRHAGGIIADMREEGDYIDWYCSGSSFVEVSKKELKKFTPEQRARYEIVKRFILEGVITDEISNDLLKLGWVADQNDDNM